MVLLVRYGLKLAPLIPDWSCHFYDFWRGFQQAQSQTDLQRETECDDYIHFNIFVITPEGVDSVILWRIFYFLLDICFLEHVLQKLSKFGCGGLVSHAEVSFQICMSHIFPTRVAGRDTVMETFHRARPSYVGYGPFTPGTHIMRSTTTFITVTLMGKTKHANLIDFLLTHSP